MVPMASAAATNARGGGTSNRPVLMPSGSLAKVCDTVLGNELVAFMLQSEATALMIVKTYHALLCNCSC